MRRLPTWIGAIAVAAAGVMSLAAAQELSPGARLALETRHSSRIVGGETAMIENWPALASFRGVAPNGMTVSGADISGQQIHYCGGAAITADWVLTAAHCVSRAVSYPDGRLGYVVPETGADGRVTHPQFGPMELVFATDDLGDETRAEIHPAAEVLVHPDYVPEDPGVRDPKNDVALVRLAVPWTGPLMAISPGVESDPAPGIGAFVAGFGAMAEARTDMLVRFTRAPSAMDTYAGSRFLRQALMPVVDNASCRGAYEQFEADSQLCVGFESGGVDSCTGDSGGPLVAPDANQDLYQVGVVSYGYGCAEAGLYGVYTRVSHFADWIASHVPEVVRTPREEEEVETVVRDALTSLLDALEPARDRASIQMLPSTAFRLGENMQFDIDSSVSGRLIVLDVRTNGDIVQIFPNQYALYTADKVFPANETVRFPGESFPFAFTADATEDAGRLLVIVVPEDFPVETTIWAPDVRDKGFAPKPSPSGFAYNIIQQILDYSADGDGGGELPGFAFAMAEYRIDQ